MFNLWAVEVNKIYKRPQNVEYNPEAHNILLNLRNPSWVFALEKPKSQILMSRLLMFRYYTVKKKSDDHPDISGLHRSLGI